MHLVGSASLERGLSVEELVEEDAEGPDIYSVVIGGLKEHFWCHVLVGSAEGVPLHGDVLSSPAKVADFDIVGGVEEQVFGLY